ncbi:MAG: gamma-butyrobetaine dioxygenase, partial [Gammaproteobacteria bacterium]
MTISTEPKSTVSDIYKILRASNDSTSIEIEWEDHHQSTYHHVWLRHNCSCASCRHSGTDQNMNLIENVPADIQPLVLNVTADMIEL